LTNFESAENVPSSDVLEFEFELCSISNYQYIVSDLRYYLFILCCQYFR